MALIVLEGLDGSGKTTQFHLLEQALTHRLKEVKLVSFPDYDSPSSALVKMYLAGEFGDSALDVNPYAAGAFYAVDRYASFRKEWGEAYQRGVPIFCSRYTTSNLIYQLSKLPEDQWEAYLEWTEEFEYDRLGLPRPDQVIYLEMPLGISQRLLTQRYAGDEGKKDIHENDLVFLSQCAKCAAFAADQRGWNVISCGEGDEPFSQEHIHQLVLKAVLAAL